MTQKSSKRKYHWGHWTGYGLDFVFFIKFSLVFGLISWGKLAHEHLGMA